MITFRSFRGSAGAEVTSSIPDFVSELSQYLPLKKIPPRNILNAVLSKCRVDRGMSGGLSWQAFQLSESEYESILSKLNLKPELPDRQISNEMEWEAWCYHSDFGVPFDEYIRRATEVENLRLAWEETLQRPKSLEEDERHITYIRASDEFEEYLDQFVRPE